MTRERILTLLGYDPALLAKLPAEDRTALRGQAAAWLVACLVLGGAASYAAWLFHPTALAAVLGGAGGTLFTINLLRVVHSGGGSRVGVSRRDDVAAVRGYRPSLIPAMVFVALAAMLAQPAQIPFWPELAQAVEAHRVELLDQHDALAGTRAAGTDHYRAELEIAEFPVYRLTLIWQDPKRALRVTGILCLFALLPALWSQLIAIRSIRAYEWQRRQRNRLQTEQLHRETKAKVDALLGQWPSYAAERRPTNPSTKPATNPATALATRDAVDMESPAGVPS